MGKQIIVNLNEDEARQFCAFANKQCRHPHEQARYVILKSLGLVDDGPSPKMNNRRDAKTLAERNVTAVGEIYP